MKRFCISASAYYNYLKQRKQKYYEMKAETLRYIVETFHLSNGTMGVEMMHRYLRNHGKQYCLGTIRKYMGELSLSSSIRRRRPNYKKGTAHHVFPNLLQQNFKVKAPHKVWCVDFTYLHLKDGSKRYNCTIIDVFNRKVVSSISGRFIDTRLAISALSRAILKYTPEKGLLLHSDQGSQFTSKEFIQYCKEHKIQQSMSKAGYPYDNAVMERYHNTLKHECIYQYEFETDMQLNQTIDAFAYGWYNNERPHTYNNGYPPNAVRT